MKRLIFKVFFVFVILFSFNNVFALKSTSSELTDRNVCESFEVALANSDDTITSVGCYNNYNLAKEAMDNHESDDAIILEKFKGKFRVVDAKYALVYLDIGDTNRNIYTTSSVKTAYTYMNNYSSWGGPDAAFLGLNYDNYAIKIKISGITGWIKADDQNKGRIRYTLVPLSWVKSSSYYYNNSSSILPITEWCDYEGEQLQVVLDSGDIILSSSMMLDLVNGGTSKINASILGENYVFDGKVIDKSNGNVQEYGYNKTFFDFEQSFKYALKVVNGNVTIIPLQKWKDFYNTDGGENEDSPNCEQIQLILPDGTAIVTTAYDTLLVKNVSDIYEIAELFKGKDGVISDLSPYVGEPSVSGWNYSFFDTKYHFSYSIINVDGNMQVYPIKNWLDFSEGEQLQLNFNDDTGVLTSFVNATLVDPYTEGIEEIIAKAFAGSLEKEMGLVVIYK